MLSPPGSISSRLPASADTAKPLPMALPQVDRSGVTPYSDCAPCRDQRIPVIISSKINTAPCCSVSERRPSRNPGAGSAVAVAGFQDHGRRFDLGRQSKSACTESRSL